MFCKNCKYWRRGGELEYEEGRFGNCPELKGEIVGKNKGRNIVCMTNNRLKSGICLHPVLRDCCTDSWLCRTSRPKPRNGVFADCDEHRAFLTIGENFGCIHFEAKPEDRPS